jgi:hypothetical protein
LFHPTCLHRSLTLWWLLRRQGVASELRIGVRKEQGRFEAHAWVERAGVALNDRADIGQDFHRLRRRVGLTIFTNRCKNRSVLWFSKPGCKLKPKKALPSIADLLRGNARYYFGD